MVESDVQTEVVIESDLQMEVETVGDELAALTPVERQPTGTAWFVIMAAVMAALGGILFGYDIGIVSGALLQLKQDFDLTCLQQEMVVSLLLVGALVGSLIGGFFVDRIGRRLTIILNTVVFILGAVTMAIAPVYEVLIVGRLIVGFAVSLSAIAECIYISEIAPMNQRGRLVSVNEIGITLGLLLSYAVNYALISVPSGWRYMFGLSVLPALVQGVGMFFLPSSPRFLMQSGRDVQARKVLQKLRGTAQVEGELSDIRNSLLTERDYKVCDVLSSVDNMRGRFLIGAGLVFFQQFTGQTNVLYYAPTIFKSLGFVSNTAATLATVGLGLIKVVTTSICLCCVDRFGRRHFLLVGVSVMTVFIITLGVVVKISVPAEADRPCIVHSAADIQENIATQNSWANMTQFEGTTAESLVQPTMAENSTESKPGIMQVAAFVSLMLYVGAYSYGFGPVTWLVLSEIFPAGIRGRASSLATVFNWGTNVLVSFTFLDLMNGIGAFGMFLIYGLTCSLSFLFIYCIVPETKNRSLEQISAELGKKSTLTGLSGHCCFQKLAFCSTCCHSNSHRPLPLTDSYSDIPNAVAGQDISLVPMDTS